MACTRLISTLLVHRQHGCGGVRLAGHAQGAGAGVGPRCGHVLHARICSVFVLRHGKIVRQRNFDCYLPFDTAT